MKQKKGVAACLPEEETAKPGQTYTVNVLVDKGMVQLSGWHKRGMSFLYISYEPFSVTYTKRVQFVGFAMAE